ncbi:1-phosphofructokinase family hexose kinase [Hufsiella ginkgonis]|uniref:Hexose kinase n=1 Tax=Hufsiella ginkgonis TaxID=2695274 RepID=A0A7K1XW31_9SPHI|nr:1-phosphofructokinase family hexose kinase [Hufsiella ginkgonis]MXV15184.1 hexose kinase [Hufsiella ginkgonis]
MKNIITLTLSPTIDKSTVVDKFIPEQKLSCAPPKFEPGGGGINVSRALKKLGTPSFALYPAGGVPGQLLQQLLDAEDVMNHGIATRNPSRENFIVVESATNQQFRFGMPAVELFPQEEDLILHTLKELSRGAGYVIASGGVPPGITPGFFAKLARICKAADARFVVDTSGDALEEAVNEGVYLLKPNLGELSHLLGKAELDNDSADDAARELIGKGKCEVVVVSMGAQGAYLVSALETKHVVAPVVKKQSTVGAGDSMVAGMIHALSNGSTLTQAVRMGVACGSAATMNPGTELFHPNDALRLYSRITDRG